MLKNPGVPVLYSGDPQPFPVSIVQGCQPLSGDTTRQECRLNKKKYLHFFLFSTQFVLSHSYRDRIPDKVVRVFLISFHSSFYSFALRFLFLQTHATSYSFSSATVHSKGERRKT